MTRRLVIDPHHPNPDIIATAAACLRAGGLVAFPTETVYGLGVNALDPVAVRRLFTAKERPARDPLIVHVADVSRVADVAAPVPPLVRELAASFWPGPLTLVLPRRATVPPEVSGGGDTVGVRIPAHPVALALLRAAAVPVAAPSANLFSRPSPTRAEHVLDDLGGRIDIVLDAGPTHVGVESTVLDLTTTPPTLWRPGAVTVEALRRFVPEITRKESTAPAPDLIAPHSPGLLARHYAPRTPLTLYQGAPVDVRERMLSDVQRLIAEGSKVGVLVDEADAAAFRAREATAVVSLGADLPAKARRLYSALRELDAANLHMICAADVSGSDGLAAALRDRLERAAGRIIRS